MKNKNNKSELNFTKSSVSELNDNQMLDVNGGDAISISFIFKDGKKYFYISVAYD
jgi:hypothetical protein